MVYNDLTHTRPADDAELVIWVETWADQLVGYYPTFAAADEVVSRNNAANPARQCRVMWCLSLSRLMAGEQ